MQCQCKEACKVSTGPGQIIFTPQNTILVKHLLEVLSGTGVKHQIEDDSVMVDSPNMEKTLSDVCSDTTLLCHEKESINVLLVKEGETFSFKLLSRARTLQQYCDLFESDFLVEILDEGMLTTHFQPIIDLHSKTIYGYECLIRGVRRDGSLDSPNRLFDAAQRCGLTFNLDRQARETALKTGAIKRIDEHLFINFLPTTIYNPETCLQDTFKWARTLEYDYSKLVFEVVETEKVQDFNHLAYILSYYRDQGVKTALDDVGSGFSNLNALIKLSPDIIKIDREIVDGIHADSLKQSIFDALANIAVKNGITILAEGIEEEDDFHYVMQNGADLAQGYFLGKPSVEPIRICSLQ